MSLLTGLAQSPCAIKFTSFITSLQHIRSCLSATSGDPINSGDTAWFVMHSYTNKRGIEKLLDMMTLLSYNLTISSLVPRLFIGETAWQLTRVQTVYRYDITEITGQPIQPWICMWYLIIALWLFVMCKRVVVPSKTSCKLILEGCRLVIWRRCTVCSKTCFRSPMLPDIPDWQ